MSYVFLRYPGGKPKAVTLSYDDGDRNDLKMVEILGRYGMKCTFNLNSSYFSSGNPRFMTVEEVKENLLANGHEVAAHGRYHRAPGTIRPVDGMQDVLTCRTWLETAFDTIIRGYAYPSRGITHIEPVTSYETIRSYLRDLGVVYARTLGGDNNTFALPDDWHAWMPTAHHANPKAIDYANEFAAIDLDKGSFNDRHPKLFYLWGHSYEFADKGNWDLLETLCEILGRKDDTWYATNIEIYDYVTAYLSLQYSADGTLVYNPTVQTVWMDVGGKTVCVKPGETLKLR